MPPDDQYNKKSTKKITALRRHKWIRQSLTSYFLSGDGLCIPLGRRGDDTSLHQLSQIRIDLLESDIVKLSLHKQVSNIDHLNDRVNIKLGRLSNSTQDNSEFEQKCRF